jgi:hypothetical protein
MQRCEAEAETVEIAKRTLKSVDRLIARAKKVSNAHTARPET